MTFLVYNVDDEPQKLRVLKRFKNVALLRRFRQEVDVAKKLEHPNIVRYVDDDLDAAKPYLVVEHCEKGPLSAGLLEDWDTLQKLEFFEQILRGVGLAHNKHVIHRDLKPENIFIKKDARTPVVGDFGICFVSDGERLTLTEEAVGSRKYTAPELEDGRARDVTPEADVYSLGKLLYWIFAGRVYDREKHRDPEWDLTREGNVDLPHYRVADLEFVNELLDRSAMTNPADRFSDAMRFRVRVNRTIWQLQGRSHVLSLTARHICNFCGFGEYEATEDSDEAFETSTFGLVHARAANFLVLSCNLCGHVQLFRRDLLRQDPWLQKPTS